MKLSTISKLKRTQQRHKPGVAEQTGFPSPATHYLEPTIDLHQELVANADATYYIRVTHDEYTHFNITQDDVLIVDRSLNPTIGALALVVKDGDFDVLRLREVPKNTLQMVFDEFILWGIITYVIQKAL